MPTNIAIVRAQTGNTASIANAFRFLGVDVNLTDDPEQIASADKLVWPGQASFSALASLRENGVLEAVSEQIRRGKPYFGICLGMQALFESSEEGSTIPGLGVLKGKVQRFSPPGQHAENNASLKVPHMGWNTVAKTRTSHEFLDDVESSQHFYFVHSYYAHPADESCIVLRTNHGVVFPAAVSKDNIFATQFHPEKSQDAGISLLAKFAGVAFTPRTGSFLNHQGTA